MSAALLFQLLKKKSSVRWMCGAIMLSLVTPEKSVGSCEGEQDLYSESSMFLRLSVLFTDELLYRLRMTFKREFLVRSVLNLFMF